MYLDIELNNYLSVKITTQQSANMLTFSDIKDRIVEIKHSGLSLPITELLSVPKAHIHCGPPGT
jgi:hypothetical protein